MYNILKNWGLDILMNAQGNLCDCECGCGCSCNGSESASNQNAAAKSARVGGAIAAQMLPKQD